MRDGAALRALVCREQGPRDELPTDWYELGVDGRQALIRRMAASAPPKVLAREKVAVPNGKRVRLTAECVPDGDGGLVLALRRRQGGRARPRRQAAPRVDRRARRHAEPPRVPAPRQPSPRRAVWDDFEVREATVAAP